MAQFTDRQIGEAAFALTDSLMRRLIELRALPEGDTQKIVGDAVAALQGSSDGNTRKAAIYLQGMYVFPLS
jgi:hypothetical protein